MNLANAAGPDPDQGQEAQLTVVGALRVVRMLPMLQVSGFPVIDEATAIVMSRGRDPYADVARDAEALRRFYDVGDDIPQDFDDPLYLQLAACGVILAVAGFFSLEERRALINFEGRRFWGTCDSLVDSVDGDSLPLFRGIKTTLEGVEDIWWERDWAVVTSGVPLSQAFESTNQRIEESIAKRREVAVTVGWCAGWLLSEINLIPNLVSVYWPSTRQDA